MHWPELTAATEEFRLVRGRTLEITADLSEEQARKRLRLATWSVGEVLDHIVRAERGFRKYQLEAMEHARAGTTGTIRLGFREVDTRVRPFPISWMPIIAPVLLGLHAVTPFEVRRSVMRKRGLLWAAAPKVAVPSNARTLRELREDLEAEVQKTAAVFEGDLPDTLPLIRISHPLYGSNNVARIVLLMGAHEERHQQQLRAILKEA